MTGSSSSTGSTGRGVTAMPAGGDDDAEMSWGIRGVMGVIGPGADRIASAEVDFLALRKILLTIRERPPTLLLDVVDTGRPK
jgi:hypothetical protein